MNILKVTFRYISKLDRVVMFYYDEHKTLVEVSFQEGHNDCCLDYYRLTKPITNLELIEVDLKRFNHWYSDYKLVYRQHISINDNLLQAKQS